MSVSSTTVSSLNHEVPSSSAAVPGNELLTGAALSGLDLAGRAAIGVDSTIDLAAETINSAIPATTRLIAGLFVPEYFNNIIVGTTDALVHAGTWIGAGTARAVYQSALLGAPAWAEAARQAVAVAGAARELGPEEGSRGLLARCFAENQERPVLREAFNEYLTARRDLALLRAASKTDEARIGAAAERISDVELKFREYREFQDLKLILENGSEFIRDQYRRIDALAERTADRIIDRVGSFYLDNTHAWAGSVSGPWSSSTTEGEREQLRDRIAGRLRGMFERELSTADTKIELDKLVGDLQSSFGTYQKSLRAAIYTVLGVGVFSGLASELVNAGLESARELVGSIAVSAGAGIGTAYNGLQGLLSSQIQSVVDATGDSIGDSAKGVIEPMIAPFRFVAETVGAGINAGAETFGAAKELVTGIGESIGSGYESLSDSITAAMNPPPDYSHPYWSGTNKVWMIGPDGPVLGESCTSGLPSTPRFNPESTSFDSLSEFFNATRGDPPSLLDPHAEPISPRVREALLQSSEMKDLLERADEPPSI